MSWYERPDGCRLYHELHGPEAGPPLLLLEGLGGDIPGWRRNIPHLAERYRVVAYDFRGNGRSDKPHGPLSMRTLVDDTFGLLEHLGIDSAHAYGQSMGGMVGIEMALVEPQRIRSLVLGASHAGRRRAIPVGPSGRVPKVKPYLALYSEGFAREHPDHIAEDILVGSQNPQPLHASRRQWEAVDGWDAWDRLPEIRVPTLVLHGTEDRLVSAENARRMAEAIPGAELVLLDRAGHVFHSECPDEADAAVLSFLDRVEAGR
jgi:pimeloyl-ACP methyl ester carboxylesterase